MEQEPQTITEYIVGVCAGYFTPAQTDSVAAMFQVNCARHVFDQRAAANFLRICNAQFSPRAFFRDALLYPQLAELLPAIAANSNFLTDVLVRYPGYAYYLFPGIEQKTITADSLRNEVTGILRDIRTPEAATAALTRIKLREMLRIGAGDLLGIYTLERVTQELTVLATALGSALFEKILALVSTKARVQQALPSYCIAALGKLGGGELNYSSDIDLILVFEENRILKNGMEAFEVFSRAVQLFTSAGSRMTGEGLFYRIDFRLRPDGKNSPLARTLGDFLRYYESRGEDWERQMLIKADFFCGDRKLYNSCMQYLTGFIYPASFRAHPLEQIKRLRRIVTENVSGELNIKQSPGGLRDIEFPVQALQLLNGGRQPGLRTGNTLQAIALLRAHHLLTEEEAYTLEHAYRFFRAVEHYLQLMDDRQTHTLPPAGATAEKCARYFGKKSCTDLTTATEQQMASVLAAARAITGDEPAAVLDQLPGASSPEIKRSIAYLREGRTIFDNRGFDTDSISAFTKLEPLLAQELFTHEHACGVLQSFAKLTALARFPSQFYKSCLHPPYLSAMLTICANAPRLLEECAQSPEIAALLIDGNPAAAYSTSSTQAAARLRFISGYKYTVNGSDSGECGISLRNALLRKFAEACGEVKSRNKIPYFIAGLGSFGSGDMVPDSDIDLIILHRQGASRADFQVTAASLYSALANAASPFVLDSRLRPEGKKAQLSWDITAAGNYLARRARAWEFMAFTRLQFVYGDRGLFDTFTETAARHSSRFPADDLRREITVMRKRLFAEHAAGNHIKSGAGGITDIEFIAQHYVLGSPERFLRLHGKPMGEILRAASGAVAGAEQLADSYRILKNQLFELYLSSGSSRKSQEQNTAAAVMSAVAGLFNKYFMV